MFLKISQNSQENTCAWDRQLYLKETLAQLFPCEFCEIFKNTFFYRTPVVASKMEWLRQKRDDFMIMHHLENWFYLQIWMRDSARQHCCLKSQKHCLILKKLCYNNQKWKASANGYFWTISQIPKHLRHSLVL